MNKKLSAIFDHCAEHPNKEYRAVELGRAVGLKKTPYLLNMLDWLVTNGWLYRRLGEYGGFTCWYYYTTEEAVSMLKLQLWNDAVRNNGEES